MPVCPSTLKQTRHKQPEQMQSVCGLVHVELHFNTKCAKSQEGTNHLQFSLASSLWPPQVIYGTNCTSIFAAPRAKMPWRELCQGHNNSSQRQSRPQTTSDLCLQYSTPLALGKIIFFVLLHVFWVQMYASLFTYTQAQTHIKRLEVEIEAQAHPWKGEWSPTAQLWKPFSFRQPIPKIGIKGCPSIES